MPHENDGSPEMRCTTFRNKLEPASVIPALWTASHRNLRCILSSVLRASALLGRKLAIRTSGRVMHLCTPSWLEDIHLVIRS